MLSVSQDHAIMPQRYINEAENTQHLRRKKESPVWGEKRFWNQKRPSQPVLSLPYKYSKAVKMLSPLYLLPSELSLAGRISLESTETGSFICLAVLIPCSLIVHTLYVPPLDYTDFAQIWVTAQTSKPKNTRVRPERSQHGRSFPSCEISSPAETSHGYLNFKPGLGAPRFSLLCRYRPSLLQILDGKLPWSPTTHGPRLNVAPSVCCGEIPVVLGADVCAINQNCVISFNPVIAQAEWLCL